MEQTVGIVTDSSCDLPQHLIERFKIVVAPLVVRFGRDVYQDGELSPEEFWEKAAGPHRPYTSQPSVGMFEQFFENLIAQGKQVLCLTVTGKLSGTFNAASVAAQRFGEAVRVLDSLSMSMGLGLQVLAAARSACAGCSMEQIVAQVEDMRARMHIMILLESLENLRRGGRADALIAIVDRMTRALNIRPVIDVVDGQLRLMGAARSIQGGLRRMTDLVERLRPLENLAVVHTRRHDRAQDVAQRLAQLTGFPSERVWVRETGAVLSAHAGAGVIAILALPAKQ